jgi:CMP/dCMP kinase
MAARRRPVIAIDGPVGAGKSTVARELAHWLGFTYVNTGAMYRAVAVAACYKQIEADDPAIEARLGEILNSISITFEDRRVMLNGHDISAEITAPAIGDWASRLSTLSVVRTRMRELQRAAGREGGVVMEGRDIGTAVFPDAEFKFYLTADINVRAERRWAELAAKGVAITREAVAAQVRERDARDQGRELAPLRRADDAIVIDSTSLNVAQVVNEMKARVESGFKDLKPA